MLLSQTDIESQGFGTPWGITRSWANTPQNFQQNVIGYGMVISEQPYVLPVDGFSTVALISNATTARYFDQDTSNSNLYKPRFFLQEKLEYIVPVGGNDGEYVVTDTTGAKLRFYDFFNTNPSKRGQFKSHTDAAGNVTTAIYSAFGQVSEVQRSSQSGGATETFLYTYVTSGPNTGLIASVTQRSSLGIGFTDWRKAEYAYYIDADANGSTGDLKTVTIKDGSNNVLDTTYYRYYESNTATGFKHGLKYVFMPESYARLAAAFPAPQNPQSKGDGEVAPFADHYFEYNSEFMVSKEKAQGAGCACNGGLGEFNFTYYDRSTEPGYTAGYNSWKMRTTESLPDGNQNIVYTNDYGQVMLEVFYDVDTDGPGPDTYGFWHTYYHFDAAGRVDFRAEPSAVTGYDQMFPDLMGLDYVDSGNYWYLNDATGNITDYTYYPTTGYPTGGAPGYLSDIGIRTGELGTIAAGTKIPQSHTTYRTITDGSNSIYLPNVETAYAGLNSGMPVPTYHSYINSGLQVTYTTTLEPGGGYGTQTVLDSYGRPTWQMDPGGFIHYTEYDALTGAVVKTIVDVDTSLVTGEPSFYNTPTGGGIHAVTTYEVDGLGRPTKITDPNGNVTRMVYKDASHEIRIYEGIVPDGFWPTNPTVVIRDDRANGYTEVLTMANLPQVSGGVFTGNEAISNVQSLSRTFYNAAGQADSVRDYFQLAGLTYSTSAALGTLDTNYYERTLAYDGRGRESRVKRGDGMIYRTVYDGLGRPTSEWIGTNDTPASGTWSETNSAGMLKIKAYTYDGGGAGDSRLTSVSDALNRTTTFGYDFRGRLASTTLPDPDGNPSTNDVAVYRQDYDNLSRITATTDATGIFSWDHQTTTHYSDWSPRAVSKEYPDPDGSGPLARPYSSRMFDERLNVISAHDGLNRMTRYAYDGAGRLISSAEPDTIYWDEYPAPTTTYAYDDAGNLVTITDPRGGVTTNTYDRANRLETVTEPDPDGSGPLTSPITNYAYDQGGRLRSLIDPSGNATTWFYDGLGRVTGEWNSLSDFRWHEYDAASRLTKKTDRNGRITQYEYNTFDQMTAEKWYDGETLLRTLGYTFDNAGQLTGTSDPAASYGYGRDVMGRVTTETQNIAGLMPSTTPDIEYVRQYNVDGFRTELTAEIGGTNDFKNTYVPDNLQRLTSLIQQGNGGNAVAEKRIDFSYNAAGQFDTISRYAGTTTSELVANTFYRYDGFARLDQLVHSTDTTAPTSGWGAGILAGYQFAYDAASRIEEINSYRDGLSAYGYDETHQLTSADHALQTDETYAYDLNGNRSTNVLGSSNQVLSDGTYRYTYDAEGNRIRRTELATGKYTKYAYDHRNRLVNALDFDPAQADGDPGQGMSWGWGASSGGGTGIGPFDPGSELGEATGTIYVQMGENVVWDEELQEYVTSPIYVGIELRAAQGAEGDSVDLYARWQEEGHGSIELEYWTADGTASAASDYLPVEATSFWLSGTQWAFAGSVVSVEDGLVEGNETVGLYVRTVQTQDSAWLLPAIVDNDQLLTFTAAVAAVPEGDDIVLTLTATSQAQFEYWMEDVSASPDDYAGIYAPAVGFVSASEASQGTATLATFADTLPETRESFRLRVRIVGQPATELLLEADILDLRSLQTVEYGYDTYNRLVRRTLDADGEGVGSPTDAFYSHEAGQVALQFDGPAAGDLSHRYLWNPAAVDQLLADEAVTSLSSAGSVLWPLTDHLGTIRDLATYDEVTHETTIANHRQYDSFGNLISETNAAIDELFGYTGRLWDEATKLQNNLNRWYDPSTGRWLSEDPIGFAGDPTNPYRYVSNSPLLYTDPLGLEGDDPWTSMGGWNPWSWSFLGIRHVAGTVSGYDSAWWESVHLDNVIKGQQREDAMKNGDINGYTNGMRMSPSQAQFCESAATANYEAMAAGGPLGMAKGLADDLAALGPEHHIMTNKNNISKAAGGPYTPKFEALAGRRGITLKDAMNRMNLSGHQGPHAAYNAAVYDRLQRATRGLKGDKFNKAFDATMECLRKETAIPGSALNKLATGQLGD